MAKLVRIGLDGSLKLYDHRWPRSGDINWVANETRDQLPGDRRQDSGDEFNKKGYLHQSRRSE